VKITRSLERTVEIKHSKVDGCVSAPPSKSYTHRAICTGALSTHTLIYNPLISADTEATIEASMAFGASIDLDDEIMIDGVEGRPKLPDNIIYAANSGTTLRFMMAIASLVNGTTVLTGDASLRKRPNHALIGALNDLGARVTSTKGDGTAPIIVKGRLKGGETYIDGLSSQFISALLIASPLADGETTIHVEDLRSRPYVEMTMDVLKEAGVKIESDFAHMSADSPSAKFHIDGDQRYDLRSFTVPGDFSSSSYILASAAITNSEVLIRDLSPSKQGDSKIVEILNDMGANISWDYDIVHVSGADLHGSEIDVYDVPDLMPIIAVLGAVADGETEITNAEHLRYKESDRLHTMTTELRRMGVKIDEKRDGLVIKGSKLKGCRLNSYNDHRIAMALTVAGLAAKGNTVINDIECVNVSYPNFFHDLMRLGADISI
jgi:3-phosphoshikimate 1-carboxyvinyltransferase